MPLLTPALRCEAVLFDLDGVLVDSEGQIAGNVRLWAARHGLDPARVRDAAHGRTVADVVAALTPHLDLAAELAAIRDLELSNAGSAAPMPGAADLLAALAGRPWAVVTSTGAEVARRRFAALGVPAPAVLVAAEDVTAGKPHPEGYLAAARALGAAPENCVVFEDSPAGVAAGRSAGATVVGLGAAVRGAPHWIPDLTHVTVGAGRRIMISLGGASA
ncbi:HAD-IA family hydrolase [Pseudosporangium ferrugineum]|uniref:Sugar-phosphatase n=1 Tax=Pseudosporangium ferrugineum TaxID=439699 RepID=A0A2T0SBB5_9ACTN|nr:HAD-IA family hydrolase [Pseudosporangium ferrugineum]PRY30719.1 sugar-phosphatase [Pseudosporangium ferrugineum]